MHWVVWDLGVHSEKAEVEYCTFKKNRKKCKMKGKISCPIIK